ncbi:MAG: S9 family peptidase [Bacteroidetes bacterium]|nr:S9 family peptidase [Bacteroidota bacterium]
MNISSFTAALLILSFTIQAQQRPIRPEDTYRMQSLSAPRLSPDGQWVLYTQSRIDSAKDSYEGKLYMTRTDGSETIQLTEQTKGTGQPAWSPDDRYISFLSKGKPEESGSQIFLMNRKGGEPIQLTQLKAEIAAYKWFPDGKRILLELKDPSTADTAKSKVRKPYEIRRHAFKNDSEGYLDERKTHLYLFDIQHKKLDTLTRGHHNESSAVIHPDGKHIAFVSNTTADPDLNENTDIFLLDIASGSRQQVTQYAGENGLPRFSPDGKWLSYSQSATESGFNMYELSRLWVYDIAGKSHRCLSQTLDHSVSNVAWSPDSRYIFSTIEDDRRRNLLRFDVATAEHSWATEAHGTYGSLEIGKDGQMAALYSDPYTPNEIYVGTNARFRRLTQASQDFLAPLRLSHVSGYSCTTVDKNTVHGLLYLPDSSARNLPLILYIHGGPVAQDEFGFDMSRQVLSGAGYAVAAVNYRGSSGRGSAYTKSISADWGNKEVKDILATVDHLVRTGVADPDRLAIAGWSYGGILTNYSIATDKRFKAAVSGAGSSLQLSMYGSDQYIRQYEEELGKPWKNPKKWLDLSYPFFKVESIQTPTLFMASEDDFNVPVIGAEQMYQAFRSTGIPTELVIYPNQHHGIRVPSYIVHRYHKHLEWFGRYLGK